MTQPTDESIRLIHALLQEHAERPTNAGEAFRIVDAMLNTSPSPDAPHAAAGDAELIDLIRSEMMSKDHPISEWEVQFARKIKALPMFARSSELAALHRPTPAGDAVERVADAIEAAQCKGREGPFGGYDYGYPDNKPVKGGRYVIRDFRNPRLPDWGKWLHQTDDRPTHAAMLTKMTREHIARAAIAALGDVAGWRPIETAPYNTAVEIKAGRMTFEAVLVPNGSEDEGGSCDQWQAAHEGEHPPCWSEGACWSSNVDEVCSLQPTHWRPTPETHHG